MRSKIIVTVVLFAFSLNISSAQKKDNKDPLSKASAIAQNAAHIEASRIQAAAENLANMHTTSSTYKKPPYRRKIVFVKSKKNRLAPVIKQDFKAKFKTVFSPNHIAANPQGYVQLPNVTEEIEKADIEEAKNRYEMNLEVFKISEAIKKKTISLLK